MMKLKNFSLNFSRDANRGKASNHTNIIDNNNSNLFVPYAIEINLQDIFLSGKLEAEYRK